MATGDVVLIAAVRLPAGEYPFMRESIEESAPTMNATSEPQVVKLPAELLANGNVDAALRMLGIYSAKLEAAD